MQLLDRYPEGASSNPAWAKPILIYKSIDKYRFQNHIGRVLNAKAEQNSKNKRQTMVTSFELYFTTDLFSYGKLSLPHSSGDYCDWCYKVSET